MNLTVPVLLLPTLGLFYDQLVEILSTQVNHDDWKLIKIIKSNSTDNELANQVMRLISSRDIPVLVSNGSIHDFDQPNTMEWIFADHRMNEELFTSNKSIQKVVLLDRKEKLQPTIDKGRIRGRIIFLFWESGEIYCRNSLWMEKPKLSTCFANRRQMAGSLNISVYLQQDKISHIDRTDDGNYFLGGYMGFILYELMKYLNVNFVYAVQQPEMLRKNVFRQGISFIRPLQGICLGKLNETLSFVESHKNLSVQLYIWSRNYHNTATYRSLPLGKLNVLNVFYGGASIQPTTWKYLLSINSNYIFFTVLFLLMNLVALTKLFITRNRSLILLGNLWFDLVAQCLGQINNQIYNLVHQRLLLSTFFLLAYFIACINNATLVSLMSTTVGEKFTSFEELNTSNREIILSDYTRGLFGETSSIDHIKDLRIVTPWQLRDELYHDNSGKGFLLEEEMATAASNFYNTNQKIKLMRLDHQFASRLPSLLSVSRNFSKIPHIEAFQQRMIENGILPQFVKLSHMFLKGHDVTKLNEESHIIGFSNLRIYFRMLIFMYTISIAVFFGELGYHYYQII